MRLVQLPIAEDERRAGGTEAATKQEKKKRRRQATGYGACGSWSKKASRQAKPCSAREDELRSSSLKRALYQDAPASSGSAGLFQVPGRGLRSGSCQGAVCRGRFGNEAYRCCGHVWRLALDPESCGKSLAVTCRSTAPHPVAHPCADDRSSVRRPTVPPLPSLAPASASCREDVEHKCETLFRFFIRERFA
ncbi:hypothetical protein HPB50_014506 [Hyalomma asiaticum]|uniref:Uncharacterized protein n=1 Tax=Hyalomma asiaticum TaxID=266040 RepID=A0ACB7SJS8_HYAAI|nr:hypothetical protein HPB50_014506 [Hyalomma asiaticum]